MDERSEEMKETLNEVATSPEVKDKVQKVIEESAEAPKKTRKKPVKEAAAEVDTVVVDAPLANKNPALCQHPEMKKDKYGKVIQVYVTGKGMVSHCASCGTKITSFHRAIQPNNVPGMGKAHMSKKDRKLSKRITEEARRLQAQK